MKADSLPELGVIMRPGMPIRRRKTIDNGAIDANKTQKESPILPQNESFRDSIKNGVISSAIKIYVKALEIDAQCGVYAHEMGVDRKLIIDIEIEMQPNFEVVEDELQNTYDYDKLADIARNIAAAKHYHLIETYAADVAKAILEDFRIKRATIKVEKPNSVKGALASGTEITCYR